MSALWDAAADVADRDISDVQPDVTVMRLGMFNFGLSPRKKHTNRSTGIMSSMNHASHIISTHGGLDLLCTCQFSGDTGDIPFRNVANADGRLALEVHADPVPVQLLPALDPRKVLDPRLFVTVFKVAGWDTPVVYLVVGNLDMPFLKGKLSVPVSVYEPFISLSLEELDNVAVRDAYEPVVKVLVGDHILKQGSATRLVAKQTGDSWCTHAPHSALRGDVLFSKGASATSFEIPFGASYTNFLDKDGIHDAFGISIELPTMQVPRLTAAQTIYQDIMLYVDFFEATDYSQALVIHHFNSLFATESTNPAPEDDTTNEEVSCDGALLRIENVIRTRDDFLTRYNLPHNWQMLDDDRAKFIKEVRKEYENDEDQVKMKKRDFKEAGNKGQRTKARSRWQSEMRRRCGSKALWEHISFTGEFDGTVFARGLLNAEEDKTGASQLSDNEGVVQRNQVVNARRLFRKAKYCSLKRQRGDILSETHQKLLDCHDKDELRREVNRLTTRFGHGHLYFRDGSTLRIGGNVGATRHSLDR